MPAESAEDRLAFVDADDFGALATYTPTIGEPVPDIAGQFDNPTIAAFAGESESTDRKPTFFCRAADLPSTAQGGDAGDLLTIDAVAYRVADLRPDGTGFILITLGKGASSP